MPNIPKIYLAQDPFSKGGTFCWRRQHQALSGSKTIKLRRGASKRVCRREASASMSEPTINQVRTQADKDGNLLKKGGGLMDAWQLRRYASRPLSLSLSSTPAPKKGPVPVKTNLE